MLLSQWLMFMIYETLLVTAVTTMLKGRLNDGDVG
jgi:hypothetical protein